jgi:hypothetical protein
VTTSRLARLQEQVEALQASAWHVTGSLGGEKKVKSIGLGTAGIRIFFTDGTGEWFPRTGAKAECVDSECGTHNPQKGDTA